MRRFSCKEPKVHNKKAQMAIPMRLCHLQRLGVACDCFPGLSVTVLYRNHTAFRMLGFSESRMQKGYDPCNVSIK